ncbi:MAG: PIN domain-containing protein [Isosphaeraceae bacterium]
MIDRALIDTGPMVALFSEGDQHHERCSEALSTLTPPLLTCWPVVTEAAWLLRKQPVDLHNLFKSFAGGLFALLTLEVDDLPAVAALMKRYESSALQLADAALAHLAEREHIRTIFTTDRRDFAIIRLKRNRVLKIIP